MRPPTAPFSGLYPKSCFTSFNSKAMLRLFTPSQLGGSRSKISWRKAAPVESVAAASRVISSSLRIYSLGSILPRRLYKLQLRNQRQMVGRCAGERVLRHANVFDLEVVRHEDVVD